MLINLRVGRYALGVCMAVALLAGCGASQPPIGALGAMPPPTLDKEHHRTFDYVGAVQYFKAPRDQRSLTILAYGATGGSLGTSGSGPGIGGAGGTVKATIAVKPGQLLEIFVGGMPPLYNGYGGYNGGGAAGGNSEGSSFGLGGGGASDVRKGFGAGLADRVLVAGGGGGPTAKGGSGGAGGGKVGEAGGNSGSGSYESFGGDGGTQRAGGAGGAGPTGSCPGGAGASGMLGLGGEGGESCFYQENGGGGGGGGYYGGGGGGGSGGCYEGCGGTGYGGGGGGGSSYVEKRATNVSDQRGAAPRGNGQVIISWYGKRL